MKRVEAYYIIKAVTKLPYKKEANLEVGAKRIEETLKNKFDNDDFKAIPITEELLYEDKCGRNLINLNAVEEKMNK